MKFLFALIGIYLGALVDQWSGAFFGFFIGILAGTLIQYSGRIRDLEEQIKLIRTNLIDSQSIATEPEQPAEEVDPEADTEIRYQSPDTSADTDVETATVSPQPQHTGDDKAWTETPLTETEHTPSGPSIVDKLTGAVKHFFTSGNVVVKVGVIVIFFGVAFLLKYAAERNAFPVELRFVSVAAGGIAMMIFGWYLRFKKPAYALVLQGGAVGILYLTVFTASNERFAIVPLGFAFMVMLALVILSCLLAVIQNARSLAVLAAIGGFLAPVLTSTGKGNHVALFSYYALLNLGIFGVAWYKSWRPLNWVGFVFTFVIASLWGYHNYQPAYFNTTEPFLIFFFLLYVAIAVLFAHRQPPELKGLVDGTLVFGTPLVGFTLQSALVDDYEFGQALSALAISAVYMVLAKVLWKKQIEGMRLLTEAFLALGVIFASLAIPFALDGRWTAAAWAVEGAGMTWIGIRQQRLLPRLFGLLLHIGGAVAFLMDAGAPRGDYPLLNSFYVGCVLISLCGLFSAFYFHRFREQLTQGEKDLHILLLIWGLCWWFAAGLLEIDRHVSARFEINTALAFIAVSLLLLTLSARRLQWHTGEKPAALLLPVMAVTALYGYVVVPGYPHPFANFGYLAWITAFVIHYRLLYRCEQVWAQGLIRLWHSAGMWLLIFVIAWTTSYTVSRSSTGLYSWGNTMWGLIPATCVFLLLHFKERLKWPIRSFPASYLGSGLFPVMIFLACWTVVVCFNEANPAPLPYIPVLNPQDLVQLFSILLMFDWLRQWKRNRIPVIEGFNLDTLLAIVAAICFIWLNAVVAHAVHFYGGVRYALHPMFDSALFQTSISIMWTLTAFIIMGTATRKVKRKLWFTGAGLLAAAVIKLFIIDLADSGTVTRIVSFLSVGGLMLVIGYISPIPPRYPEEKLQT